MRCGRGFSYVDECGVRLPPSEVQRIRELAIPPAWRDVWICPSPRGHLQAVGTDDEGRRQYLYHPHWRRRRDVEKFERVSRAAADLPRLRARLRRDLRAPAGDDSVERRRVLALGIRLLDLGCFRPGSDTAAESGSHGLTTLESRHVRRVGEALLFCFDGKVGVEQEIRIDDRDVVRIVMARLARRTRTDRVLASKVGSRWVPVRAEELNERLDQLTAASMTAKDFRTWHATTTAATTLAASPVPTSRTGRRRRVREAMVAASELLGNTPSVARSAYVDPRIVDLFDRGIVLDRIPTSQNALDRAVSALLTSHACVPRQRLTGSGREPLREQLLPLLGTLAAVVLSASEELGELAVTFALGVGAVGLQTEDVVQARLGEPQDVVVLVGGAGDGAGIGRRSHRILLFPASSLHRLRYTTALPSTAVVMRPCGDSPGRGVRMGDGVGGYVSRMDAPWKAVRRRGRAAAKIAVVTGGSGGVGRAIVRELSAHGYDVAVMARGRAGVEGAVAEVEENGRRGLPLLVDVSDHRAVRAGAQQVVAEWGAIDLWVNTAFVGAIAYSWDLPPKDVHRITEVTYLGQVHGTLAALEVMRPRDDGVIINVGSALAYRGIPLQAAYCGAKHAVKGFTESVMTELRHEHSHVRLCMVELPGMNTTQFSWNKNTMDADPQPVPPLYQPEVAARVVRRIAARPRRNSWVGIPTAYTILGNRLAPGLLDRYLGRTGVRAQLSSEPLPRWGSNLRKPRDETVDRGAHGPFDKPAHAHEVVSRLGTVRGAPGRAVGAVGRLVGRRH